MSSDWQRKPKPELKNSTFKEFEGRSHHDHVTAIAEFGAQNADLKEQLFAKNTAGAGKGQKQPLIEIKYKQDWSYPTKIHFFLELHQKPLTSEDLHDLFLKIDNHYKDYDSPRNNLSVALGRAS